MRKRLRSSIGWAGADEAGRGPLAGPVVAAAALLPRGFRAVGIDDSKKLTRAEREELAGRIRAKACWAVAVCTVEEIDRLNILRASLEAMRKAILALPDLPEGVLVDGTMPVCDLPIPCKPVVDGDAIYASIAAAGILAKVHRDALMTDFAQEFPEYGFDKHFGYSTRDHFRALEEHGPCPIHRRSFAPIRNQLLQPCLDLGA